MFLSKENLRKNYSVIIVPERGSKTKTFELSAKLIKVCMAVFFIALILITILVIYFINIKHNTSELSAKEKYIRSLEEINKANIEKINSLNKNKDIIKNKLNEIQQLEDLIKNKLNKSITLKNQNITPSRHAKVIKYSGNLVKEMENKIITLSQINKKVSSILEVEQFIPSKLPCIGYITSYFGYRKNPFNNIKGDYHDGIDISCSSGTKIYASASGTVEQAGRAPGYGNKVLINHHNGVETIYGHNSKILVHVGQTVNKGDLIALSGSTGSSTGPHLHFEIRKNKKAVDPIFVYKKGVKKNGF